MVTRCIASTILHRLGIFKEQLLQDTDRQMFDLVESVEQRVKLVEFVFELSNEIFRNEQMEKLTVIYHYTLLLSDTNIANLCY